MLADRATRPTSVGYTEFFNSDLCVFITALQPLHICSNGPALIHPFAGGD
jgi:hypothetical protein